jgi:hypothetical protein
MRRLHAFVTAAYPVILRPMEVAALVGAVHAGWLMIHASL